MRKFEVLIRGNNFLVEREGKVRKTGFYAARFVEANDSSAALEKAMDSIRSGLKDAVRNDPSDPPSLKVEVVEEVYYFNENMEFGDMLLPGRGFYWDLAD